MSEGSLAFNPEFDPDGAEGGVDTNLLPWLRLSGISGLSVKPLRASMESGMFNMIVRLEKGAVLNRLLSLSGMDLLVLSGALDYADDSGESHLEPGIWGYLSANTCMERLTAAEESELLINCYGAFAMLTPGKRIPSGELWAGRPAKKMRDLSEDEKQFNQKSAAHYVEVARAHRLGTAGAPFAAHMKTRPLPPRD